MERGDRVRRRGSDAIGVVLDRMHLVTLATTTTTDGAIPQRSIITTGQAAILGQPQLPQHPPKFFDFTPAEQ